jgi:hypothetical protein
MIRGSCLCGAVRLEYAGEAGPITACHCTQCRKISGHYAASFDATDRLLTLTGTLAQYTSSGGGRRYFCPVCGSKILFRDAAGALSIEAGIIDGPTGALLTEHIHTDTRGDYYGDGS